MIQMLTPKQASENKSHSTATINTTGSHLIVWIDDCKTRWINLSTATAGIVPRADKDNGHEYVMAFGSR